MTVKQCVLYCNIINSTGEKEQCAENKELKVDKVTMAHSCCPISNSSYRPHFTTVLETWDSADSSLKTNIS